MQEQALTSTGKSNTGPVPQGMPQAPSCSQQAGAWQAVHQGCSSMEVGLHWWPGGRALLEYSASTTEVAGSIPGWTR